MFVILMFSELHAYTVSISWLYVQIYPASIVTSTISQLPMSTFQICKDLKLTPTDNDE